MFKKEKLMFYKLLINYFRLRVLRFFLTKMKGGGFLKGKNLSLLSVGLEILFLLLENKKKTKAHKH
jgi:hypothetical protein